MPVLPPRRLHHALLTQLLLCVIAVLGCWILPSAARANNVEATPRVDVNSTSGEVTISWRTGAPSTSLLKWDLQQRNDFANYHYSVSNAASTPSKQHSRSIRNLPPGTYYFAICPEAVTDNVTCTGTQYRNQFTVSGVAGNANSVLEAIETNGNEITASASFTSSGATRVWIAGDFTRVGTKASRGIALDPSGKAMPGTPSINGEITAVTDDGAGGWYIGGKFTEVGGIAIKNVAHILADGGVDPTFAPAGVSNNTTEKILALDYDARSGTSLAQDAYFDKPRLYVGGNFVWSEANTNAGVGTQTDIVALNTVTQGSDAPGSVLNDFVVETHVAANQPGSNPEVRAILVDPSPAPVSGNVSSSRYLDNAGVYFSGTFSEVSLNHPDLGWLVDMDSDKVAKVEPNGDAAEGAVYRTNNSIRSFGYFLVPRSATNAVTSIDALAFYDQGTEAGPQLTDGILKQPPKLLVGGSFGSLPVIKNVDGAFSGLQDVTARNLAAIDSVMGTTDNQCHAKVPLTTCQVARPIDLNVTGTVSSLAAWSQGAPSSVDRLYVAGALTKVGGVDANRLGEIKLGPTPGSWGAPATTERPMNTALAAGSVATLSVDRSDSKLYVAGDFASFMGVERQGVARVNLSSKSLDTGWDAGRRLDATSKVAIGSNGAAFLAGGFTMVGGVATSRLASLIVNPAGQIAVDDTFTQSRAFAATAGAVKITTLAGNANRLYVGGTFGFTDQTGAAHANVVALNAATGVPISGFVASVTTPVRALLIGPTDNVWIGGDFPSLNTCAACANLALLTSTGVPQLASPANMSPNGPVNALATDPVGNVYVGGAFTAIGPASTPVQRNLFKMSSAGALVAAFGNQSTGATTPVTALATDGVDVFAGGVRNWNGVPVSGVARLDAATSVPEPSFATGANEGVATGGTVTSLALKGSQLWIGGAFASYQGDTQLNGLVMVDTTRGRTLGAARPARGGAGTVNTVLPLGARTLVGGNFTSYGTRGVGGLAITRPVTDVLSPLLGVNVTALTGGVKVDTATNPTTVIVAGGGGRQIAVQATVTDASPGDVHNSGAESPDFDAPFGSAFALGWLNAASGSTATITSRATPAPATTFEKMWVTGRDVAGNPATPVALKLALDTAAPVTVTPSKDVPGSTSNSIKVNFPAAGDNGLAGMKARYVERAEAAFVDGACPVASATTFSASHTKTLSDTTDTWTGLTTKCHAIRVRSVDGVDNESNGATGWLPVDVDGPTGWVDGAFPRRVKSTFTITGTATDAGSGLDRIVATVNGGVPVVCLGSITGNDVSRPFQCTLTAGIGTTNTIAIKAYDDFENSYTLGGGQVTIDSGAPAVSSVTVNPTLGATHQYVSPLESSVEPTVWIDPTQTGAFELVVMGTDDAPSGMVASTFPQIHATGWTPTGGAGSMSGGGTKATYAYTWSNGALTTAPTLTGSVKDEVDNSTPFKFHVASDAADPSVQSVVIPTSASDGFDVTATVQDLGSGLQSYAVGVATVPGSAMDDVTCTSAQVQWGTTAVPVTCRLELPDGVHEVVVQAVDHVGRVTEQRGTVSITGRSGLKVTSANTFPLDVYEGEGTARVAQRTFSVRLLDPLDPGEEVLVDVVAPPRTTVHFTNGTPASQLRFTPATAGVPFDLVVSAADETDFAYAAVSAGLLLDVVASPPAVTVADASVPVVRHDAQSVGFQVDGTPTLLEAGNTPGSYTVRLTSAPRSTVTMTIDAGARISVNPSTLTFTATNGGPTGWNTPRTVTLTPLSDHTFQPGGAESATVTNRITVGDNSDYPVGTYAPNVVATIVDDEQPTVTFSAPTSSVVSEGSGSVTFTAQLGGAPTSDVVLDFIASPGGQLVVTGDTTFTPADWQLPHTITVIAADDAFSEAATQLVNVQPSIATNDPHFLGAPAFAPIPFTVVDNDLAARNLAPGSGWSETNGVLQLPEASSAGALMAVHFATHPQQPVTITPSSTDGAVTFQPSSITIDSSWNGVDPVFRATATTNDAVDTEPAVAGSITWNVSSADPQYGPLAPLPASPFTVVDDDVAALSVIPGSGWNVPSGVLELDETDRFGAVAVVHLATRPQGSLTVTPTSTNPAVTFQPASVTIDGSWNGSDPAFRVVPVTDDDVATSPTVAGSIGWSVSGSDAAYMALPPLSTTPFTIVEDDVAGLSWVPGSGWNTVGDVLQLPEADAAGAVIAVQFASCPQYAVTVTPSSSNTSVTFQPTSVTIDNSWDGVAPEFRVVAVNDSAHASAPVAGTITWIVTGNDTRYVALPAALPQAFSIVEDDPPPVVATGATPTREVQGVTPQSADPPAVTPPKDPVKPVTKDPVKPVEPVEPAKSADPPVTTDQPAATPPPVTTAAPETGTTPTPVAPTPVAPVVPEPIRGTNDGDSKKSATKKTQAAPAAEQPRSAPARAAKWAKEHKAAAATTATAVAVGAGVAAKAVVAKGLVGMAGNAGGLPGHGGVGSLLDKIHHLRHGRRLRRGGRWGNPDDLRARKPRERRITPRERSGMHRDIFDELDEKYAPKYDDPLDRFDDAA